MKHTPATPLPWDSAMELVATNSDHPQGMAIDCARSSRSHNGDCQNAAYIAHAANAYPRLVAALADTMHLLRVNGLAHHNDQVSRAAALLAELGE